MKTLRRHYPLGAEKSAPQTSTQVAGPFVLGGSVGTASSYTSYVPAFDFVPAGYVSNVAKDEEHEAQRNTASGA